MTEKITSAQRLKLKHFVKELEAYRGRHTELVSVYIPQGYDLNKIINHLFQEQGTASNIKSKATRDNVIAALERMMQHLRLFKKTPEHGLAVFSGNVAEREGQQDYKVWSIEPPIPIKIRLYRCDKEFVLDPLREMMETKDVYGLVVMDKREGNIALLKGKTIIPLSSKTSNVPGKQRAGGQCLVKESIIQLSDGSLPRIEIVHNPEIVKSIMITNNFSIQNSNITDKWNVKKTQVYKIITKNPRLEVQSSKDHVFFVVTPEGIKEKAAEELKVGDNLIMPEKIEIKGKLQKIKAKQYYNAFIITKEGRELLKKKRQEKGLLQRELARKMGVTQTTISVIELGKGNARRDLLKRFCIGLNIKHNEFLKKYTKTILYRDIKLPIKMNSELAQFLGYLMGDGCIERDRITFFEQGKQVARAYKRMFDRFFKLNSTYRFRKSKNYHQLRFTSRPLVRLIQGEFPELKKTHDSEVPKKILKSDNKVVAAFLKGLFDAEGYITTPRKAIGFGIQNKRLAQQVQLLLLRFSIISSLHEYDNRANKYSNNPRFTIDITEKKSLTLFEKCVGFTCLKKTNKLTKTIKHKSDTSYVRQIILSGSEIRKIIENAGYNMQLFPKVSSFFINKRMMSKEIFKNSILANIKDKKLYSKLKKICDYPVLPVKISKMQKINKPAKMVDISVKNQNFIANGILVHNSAHRFERLREGAAKEFMKKIGELMKAEFLNNKNLKGIIVGGPGHTKNEFVDGNFITDQVKRKIIAIKDLSYTGEFGLQELVDKSQDVLASEEIAEEKKIMQDFLNKLATKPGIVNYGEDAVFEDLKNGIVDTLLISEVVPDKTIDRFEKEAERFGSKLVIISTETREGVQLKEMGKIACILRYEVQR